VKTKPAIGTTVRYTGTFLKNTGQQRGSAGLDRFVVLACSCDLCKRGNHVATDGPNPFDPAVLRHVGIAAIEQVGKPCPD
jgi:hypothetical protein